MVNGGGLPGHPTAFLFVFVVVGLDPSVTRDLRLLLEVAFNHNWNTYAQRILQRLSQEQSRLYDTCLCLVEKKEWTSLKQVMMIPAWSSTENCVKQVLP